MADRTPRKSFMAIELDAAYALEAVCTAQERAVDRWTLQDELRVERRIADYHEFSLLSARVEAVTR